MPLLSCTAKTCLYNKNEYCSKGNLLQKLCGEKRRRYEQYGNRYSHSDYPGGL